MSAAESPAAAAAAAARKVAFLVASNATSTEIAAAAAAASAAAEVAAAAATAAKRGTPSSVASPNTLSKTADRRDTNEPVTKFYSMDQLKLRHVEALEQIQKLHANLQRCVEAQQYAEAGRLQVCVYAAVSHQVMNCMTFSATDVLLIVAATVLERVFID